MIHNNKLDKFTGWLSDLLSCKLLVVLGRLSFGIYLVHVPLMTYFMGINNVFVQFEHTKMVRTMCQHSCHLTARRINYPSYAYF